MTARTMRKMQVPAYAPVEVGVHAFEYRGVLWAVVKTIDMEPMPDMEDMPDIPVEAAAEVVLDIAIVDDMCDIVMMADNKLFRCSEGLVAQRKRFSGCVDLREQFSRVKED
jgi:hypothetical protein